MLDHGARVSAARRSPRRPFTRRAGAVRAIAAVLVLTAGCRDRPAEVAPGRERGDCRPDRTCDVGLLCLSNLCVRPPPADCQGVGEQLASIDLGIQAGAGSGSGDRPGAVARYRAACEAARLTREEQHCLDRTHDRWSAAQCAPRMFPDLAASPTGDCGAIIARARAALQNQGDPQLKAWFDRTMAVLQASCEQDRWPDALKRCMLASDGRAAMTQACRQQTPPDLQRRLQERLNEAMQNAPP
jgi:hypothetical protein